MSLWEEGSCLVPLGASSVTSGLNAGAGRNYRFRALVGLGVYFTYLTRHCVSLQPAAVTRSKVLPAVFMVWGFRVEG